ncbi:SurA N-terminal domain-containing protein [Chitinophaga horti]|uniref:Periplasmic chaperone PpiD n=1 Tax=Chitinophaga horti TaxID=2920382 RepID=A0ABY6IZP6_9BACT|nr:peptidylprolyl isomerase [Chitinophaga horti]UYQ92862.1 SurA N-terminal domain-containing protein [Chitinophaga horti]
MSVIQKIRDKYAVVIIVVICLAIVAFLLQDAFFGRNSMMSQSTSVGKVNGETLEISEYDNRLRQQEALVRRQMPDGNLDAQTQQYVREQVWNSFINEQINKEEFSKLGITVTDAEVSDQFFGKNPHRLVQQQFTDPQTGVFNVEAVRSIPQRLKTEQNPELREQVLQFESALTQTLLDDKYKSLLKQGIYYPKWIGAQQANDGKELASISYVNVPYATIADSTVKVTESEMNDYIQKHKAMFQAEEGRRVEYVSFDALPSAADSAAAIAELTELKKELDTTAEVAAFINNNSTTKYFDEFIPNSASRHPYIDSIKNLATGTVFGPYVDQNTIGYAKIISRKIVPDSVKFRHIFIALKPGLTDSAAKRTIDSIAGAVRGGADFAALVQTYSDDAESKAKNGEYELTITAQFIPELKDFAFAEGNRGKTEVVKLPNIGYSLMQVQEQKNFGPAMKIAYLTKTVDPSAETSSKAYNNAGEFAAKYKTQAEFDKAVQEKGLNKRIADNIRPVDMVVPGLGESRELVTWAYKAEKGNISNVISLEDRYIVAVLTGAREAGTAPLSEVRPMVEPEVRKQKKAAMIEEKLKSPANLQAAASASNQPVLQVGEITFLNGFIPSLGFEPRVAGAAFNKALTGKVSAPIHGNAGVYVIKVDAYTANPNAQADFVLQKNAFEQNFRSTIDQALFQVLKKQADIKDNRKDLLK